MGSPGRDAVRTLVPQIQQREGVDFVIANAENAAGGTGITPRIVNDLLNAGCNVITAGDHIWRRREVFDIIDSETRLLRPLNFPDAAPGNGYYVYTATTGATIAVVSLLGQVFVDAMTRSPFIAIREILPTLKQKTNTIAIDFHAEATSEKVAMGWFLDGEVSCVIGSHTHVQTADERLLPKGTAYISDMGMSGPHDSVIGRKKEKVIERFLTGIPTRFELGIENVRLQGVIIEIDERSGCSVAIKRVNEILATR